MKARLREHYETTVTAELTKQFSYTNPMAVPKLVKVTVNIGMGEATQNPKVLDGAVTELTAITGQKPVITKARKSIAAFKLREGMSIGCMVTLRGVRMYEFLDRLISLALPRVRDFRGLNPNGFDGHGNYSLGLAEQLVFPELNPDKFTRPQGMNITIVTSSDSDAQARELLRGMGMPFRADQAIK